LMGREVSAVPCIPPKTGPQFDLVSTRDQRSTKKELNRCWIRICQELQTEAGRQITFNLSQPEKPFASVRGSFDGDSNVNQESAEYK
jgi:hypothetical protein